MSLLGLLFVILYVIIGSVWMFLFSKIMVSDKYFDMLWEEKEVNGKTVLVGKWKLIAVMTGIGMTFLGGIIIAKDI